MYEITLHLFLKHKSRGLLLDPPTYKNTDVRVLFRTNFYSSCFFCSGIGGSVAFCRPDPKRKLAVAVTLNRLSFDSSKTTGEIVREIFKKLNEPVPLQYAKKNLP